MKRSPRVRVLLDELFVTGDQNLQLQQNLAS
jgi:hypothetical protein